VRFLITGISGFIGGSVGRYATEAGHVVMGTGRASVAGNEWPGFYTRVDGAEDLATVIREFHPEVVINAAGTASVGASVEEPLNDFRGSVQTCADVLDAVRRSSKRPLVVIPSSAAVYGNPASLPVSEDAVLRPISPYGFHKAACELLAREYAECFGLSVLVCRFFSVFGSMQRRLLVWELYQQLAGLEKIAWLSGTGEETRDFLYIDDLSAALLGLIEKCDTADRNYLLVNVASGVETSVLKLAETIRDLVAPEKKICCRGEQRKNDPLRWRADVSRFQMLLPSWRPRALNDGLAACATAWRQMNRSSLS
jgi:nucleoside-diphosphate-sugar epimerase